MQRTERSRCRLGSSLSSLPARVTSPSGQPSLGVLITTTRAFAWDRRGSTSCATATAEQPTTSRPTTAMIAPVIDSAPKDDAALTAPDPSPAHPALATATATHRSTAPGTTAATTPAEANVATDARGTIRGLRLPSTARPRRPERPDLARGSGHPPGRAGRSSFSNTHRSDDVPQGSCVWSCSRSCAPDARRPAKSFPGSAGSGDLIPEPRVPHGQTSLASGTPTAGPDATTISLPGLQTAGQAVAGLRRRRRRPGSQPSSHDLIVPEVADPVVTHLQVPLRGTCTAGRASRLSDISSAHATGAERPGRDARRGRAGHSGSARRPGCGQIASIRRVACLRRHGLEVDAADSQPWSKVVLEVVQGVVRVVVFRSQWTLGGYCGHDARDPGPSVSTRGSSSATIRPLVGGARRPIHVTGRASTDVKQVDE